MLALLSTLTLGLPIAKEAKALDVEPKVEAMSIEAMATYNTCGWSYQYSQYGNTMTSTTKVMIGGAAEDGGALGAFVGDECRGIQSTVSKPPFGPVHCAAPNTCHSPTQPLMLDLFLLFRVRRTASSQCTR